MRSEELKTKRYSPSKTFLDLNSFDCFQAWQHLTLLLVSLYLIQQRKAEAAADPAGDVANALRQTVATQSAKRRIKNEKVFTI